MEQPLYDTNAAKCSVNVQIDGDLVAQARSLEINLSHEFELVAKKRRRTWKQENQEAIVDYNHHIEKDGLFGDSERVF